MNSAKRCPSGQPVSENVMWLNRHYWGVSANKNIHAGSVCLRVMTHRVSKVIMVVLSWRNSLSAIGNQAAFTWHPGGVIGIDLSDRDLTGEHLRHHTTVIIYVQLNQWSEMSGIWVGNRLNVHIHFIQFCMGPRVIGPDPWSCWVKMMCVQGLKTIWQN